MRILQIVLLFMSLAGGAVAEPSRYELGVDLENWKEKVFNGRVDYRLVMAEGRQVLQADNNAKASALIRSVDIDPLQTPKLRWRWKINQVLERGQAGLKAGDDYPARVYVVFDSWLPNFARSINYIWANNVEREMLIVSPYYHRSVMLAVESGNAKAGQWVIEERDLIEDYRRIFAGDIPQIKAIALMSDGDDTGQSAQAWFDWIEFSARKD